MKHCKQILLFVALLTPLHAYCTGSIGDVASNISSSLGSVSGLISAICYITGMGFGLSAIMKYKGHRDNPQQIPLSTPVTETVLALALIFLPIVARMSGSTMFGTTEVAHSTPTGQTSTDADVVPSFPQQQQQSSQQHQQPLQDHNVPPQDEAQDSELESPPAE